MDSMQCLQSQTKGTAVLWEPCRSYWLAFITPYLHAWGERPSEKVSEPCDWLESLLKPWVSLVSFYRLSSLERAGCEVCDQGSSEMIDEPVSTSIRQMNRPLLPGADDLYEGNMAQPRGAWCWCSGGPRSLSAGWPYTIHTRPLPLLDHLILILKHTWRRWDRWSWIRKMFMGLMQDKYKYCNLWVKVGRLWQCWCEY